MYKHVFLAAEVYRTFEDERSLLKQGLQDTNSALNQNTWQKLTLEKATAIALNNGNSGW